MLGKKSEHAGADLHPERQHVERQDKAKFLYVLGQRGPAGNGLEPQGKPKRRRGAGMLGLLASIGTIISAIIVTYDFVMSGQAATASGPLLASLASALAGIGMAFGRLAQSAAVLGPLVGALVLFFIVVVLRLLAETLGLFVTVGVRAARQAGELGVPILVMEYTVSCLLFLPLVGLWAGAFYSSVSALELAEFGAAYLVTVAVAMIIAIQADNQYTIRRAVLGQILGVVAALATTIALATQGVASLSAPIHNPWLAAVTALIAAIAARFLTEQLGFFVTRRVTVPGIIYGWLVLAPIAALWVSAFARTVSPVGIVGFVLAYMATMVLATWQAEYIFVIGRALRAKPDDNAR